MTVRARPSFEGPAVRILVTAPAGAPPVAGHRHLRFGMAADALQRRVFAFERDAGALPVIERQLRGLQIFRDAGLMTLRALRLERRARELVRIFVAAVAVL